MIDLVASDVEDGAVISSFSTVEEGDIYQELATRKTLRTEDWEVDEDGRRAWEMSFFTVVAEGMWVPIAGYVYESDLIDHARYDLLWRRPRSDVNMSVVNFVVPVDFTRQGWDHGKGTRVNVARERTGVITVQIVGEDLTDVHASMLTVFHDAQMERRVGRIVYVKNYTFTTLARDGTSPIDVEATILVSGKT